MTADHLQSILESGLDAAAFVSFAIALAQGEVRQEALDGITMGRIKALGKLDGGVRGIVVGDIRRRLVARTNFKAIHEGGGGGHHTLPICIQFRGQLRVRGTHFAVQ